APLEVPKTALRLRWPTQRHLLAPSGPTQRLSQRSEAIRRPPSWNFRRSFRYDMLRRMVMARVIPWSVWLSVAAVFCLGCEEDKKAANAEPAKPAQEERAQE